MGDRNGAMALAFGMSAALLDRMRTGKGSVVDVSLLATAMWTLSSDVLSALQGAKPRAMSMSASGYVNPLVGVYSTKDDRHISLVFLESDRYWPDFCRIIGREELIEDPRYVDLAARKEHAEEHMTHYYAYMGQLASHLAAGAITEEDRLRDVADLYAANGCDELLLLTCTADPGQLDRVAKALLS